MFTAALFTIARTWQQPKCSSTEKWIKKKWYNGMLLSHKKEQNWVLCRDVDGPETVIQSEVTQKEKNIVY